MEKKIPPPPTGNYDVDFPGELSRKRKSTAMEHADTIFDSLPEYCIPWNSKLQQASSVLGTDLRGSAIGHLHLSNTFEPILERQFEKDQFRYQNSFADTSQPSNGNLHIAGIEKMSSIPLGFPPQSSHFPFMNVPVGERYTYLNLQAKACDFFGQAESHKSVPLTDSQNGHSEKVEIDPCLQQSSLQPTRFLDELEGRTCTQEANKLGYSGESKQTGQYSNIAGVNEVLTVGTSSFGASYSTEQNENNRLLKNEVQNQSSQHLGVNSGETSGNFGANETTKTSDVDFKHHLMEEGFANNGDSPAKLDENNKVDDKSKLHSGVGVSTIAEKLWDGSIQLSSSVTLSAVAFFKSGEKLLDINWSQFVEVKGKVRLEAFEKYIQDLPRSRTRGLMVISLCWKEGSSETGLKGMKEVAKGYKKGQRVGFARPSPGIDLYICPRSDKIITILAKYGFFKGMAAVEDNPDSMIGCVVWRKNPTSTNSVSKKSEIKNTSTAEQPLVSPSESSNRGTEQKMSPKQSARESVESVPKSFTNSKNVDSSGIHLEVDNSLSSDNSHFDDSSVAQPKANSGLEKPILPLPHEVPKQPVPTFDDDDDLPEFDFRTACGIPRTKLNKPLGDHAEGIRKVDGSVPPTKPTEQAIPFSNRGSDLSSLPRVPIPSSQEMPPFKRLCDHDTQIPVLPNFEENKVFQNKSSTKSQPKNLFDDDDDDMPEWCPPELHKQSSVETTRPLATISSEILNPSFQIFLPGSSRPIFTSQTAPSAIQCPVTVNVKMPPSRPIQRAPTAQSNSILGARPQNGSFDAKFPFHATDKSRWRS